MNMYNVLIIGLIVGIIIFSLNQMFLLNQPNRNICS